MFSAIIFLNSKEEENLFYAQVGDYTIAENIKRKLDSIGIKDIYLVCDNKLEDNMFITGVSLKDIVSKLMNIEGKCLFLDPFYHYVNQENFIDLLRRPQGAFLKGDGKFLGILSVENNKIAEYKTVNYSEVNISKKQAKRINNYNDVAVLNDEIFVESRKKHLENGVCFKDIACTYIGENVVIGKGCIIEGNVHIKGKTVIGNNNFIEASSVIIDSIIGNNNHIISSRIVDSKIESNNEIGPNSHIREKSHIHNHCRIGNFVEFKKTDFNDHSKCAHLTYLGDSVVGKNVNVGCGVVTVNYDGKHKHQTEIGDNCFIGSGVKLIAPIKVADKTVLAAGSTITEDVRYGEMAIARNRQINKQGYGLKYLNKE